MNAPHSPNLLKFVEKRIYGKVAMKASEEGCWGLDGKGGTAFQEDEKETGEAFYFLSSLAILDLYFLLSITLTFIGF